jgi:tetratricopeptide (TPR) repeat protein
MLADIYDRVGLKDLFYKYTRQSIKALPNNPVHFILYSKMMNQLGNIDSIVNHFNKIKLTRGGSRDFQVYNITLASIVNDTLNYEKYNAIDIANEAREKFPNKPSINLLADYIIYSKENVEQAEELQKKGRKISEQGKYEESLRVFKDALALHPTKQIYLDDIILSYFALNKYKEITAYYDEYLSKYRSISDPTLYYFGLSFYNLQEQSRACDIFTFLKSRNFDIDPRLSLSCNI